MQEQQIISEVFVWTEIIKVVGQVIASTAPIVLGYWLWKRKKRKGNIK